MGLQLRIPVVEIVEEGRIGQVVGRWDEMEVLRIGEKGWGLVGGEEIMGTGMGMEGEILVSLEDGTVSIEEGNVSRTSRPFYFLGRQSYAFPCSFLSAVVVPTRYMARPMYFFL